MTSYTRADWLIPAGLVELSFIDIAAGIFRMVQLGGSAEITPDNARFFAAPLPVVLHIVSSVIYCVRGAFQFSPTLRRHKPTWHRAGGRILVPCGLVVALSGLWMTQFYPTVNFKGPFVYVLRLVVGSAMASFLCLGLASIRRGDISCHRAWMMRSYALGIGAGTQAFTLLPWILLPSIQGELARAVCLGAGWAINVALAEWLISGQRHQQLESLSRRGINSANFNKFR